MRLNIFLAIISVITLRFTGGDSLPEVRFLTYGILIALLFILLLDLFAPNPKRLSRAGWIGVASLVLTAAIIPTIAFMQLRFTYGSVTGLVHDDPIQLEAASHFLLNGKNPYVEDYTQTDMVGWSENFIYGIVNPAIYHVIALPGHILLSTLFYAPIHGWSGFFDERIVYLLAYAFTIFLASKLGRTSVERLRSIILIGLNPLMISYLIVGRNDILVLSFLLAAILLLHRRSLLSAFALLGLACTIKLFAWMFVPFFLIYALAIQKETTLVQKAKRLIRPILLFKAVVIVIIGPFIAWNPGAFYEDIVQYTNGTSVTSYPINGLGLSTMLMNTGFIAKPTDYYPFWIFQAIALGLALTVFLPRLYKQPRVSLVVFSATFTLFLVAFCSRFMNDNYVILFLMLTAVGYGIIRLEQPKSEAD